MTQTLARESARTHSAPNHGCSLATEIVDLAELRQNPVLLSPWIGRFGIAAQRIDDQRGARLAVTMLLEGAYCQ